MDLTFLAYAAFCLARAVLDGRTASRMTLTTAAGFLMMLIDVVVDPLAVQGDRWFLGRIFYYSEPGVYFGVPLANFVGWWVVGVAGVGGYLILAGQTGAPRSRLWPGVALYYAVLAFNLAVAAWIREWFLLATGVALHAVLAAALVYAAGGRGLTGLAQPGSDTALRGNA